jgi:hypothetical protein
LAAAPLGNDIIAILAGDGRTKTISLVSLSSGALIRTFGVTREANDLSSAGPQGPLLVTISGTGSDGRPMGAVESWSLDGAKEHIVPMPLPAASITRAVGNIAYVLVQAGRVRAAIPLDVANLSVGKGVALDADSRELEQCRIGATNYLVYNQGTLQDGTGTVAVRDMRTGITTRSTIVADDPTCVSGGGVYAIEKSLVNDRIAVLDVPGLQQERMLAANGDTAALYETLDHRLLALDVTDRTSTVEVYPPQTFGQLR